jgi:hypothetical protein
MVAAARPEVGRRAGGFKAREKERERERENRAPTSDGALTLLRRRTGRTSSAGGGRRPSTVVFLGPGRQSKLERAWAVGVVHQDGGDAMLLERDMRGSGAPRARGRLPCVGSALGGVSATYRRGIGRRNGGVLFVGSLRAGSWRRGMPTSLFQRGHDDGDNQGAHGYC